MRVLTRQHVVVSVLVSVAGQAGRHAAELLLPTQSQLLELATEA